jgi:hypothetical protein
MFYAPIRQKGTLTSILSHPAGGEEALRFPVNILAFSLVTSPASSEVSGQEIGAKHGKD